MAYETIVKEGNFYQSSTGDYGFRLLGAGEASVAGENFRAIQIIEAAVITTTNLNGDSLSSQSLPEGVIVFGKFNTVSVVSGVVLAYLAA
tara:strand:- start:243 stop:512 length:270 start_codon:yes stop_codon:yes gene_type:complete